MNSGYSVYKSNSINHASKPQMLLMLVDGAVKFSKNAQIALDEKDYSSANEALIRVQDIFGELMVSLDKSSGKWAEDLFALYVYIKNKLIEVNIKKDSDGMRELMPLIIEIRDMWYEASKVK